MNLNDITRNHVFDILFLDLKSRTTNPLVSYTEIEKIFTYSRLEYKLIHLIENPSKKKWIEKSSKERDLQTLISFGQYSEIAELLSRKNIFFVPLKGIHLNLEYYDNLYERPIRDIDLLVKEDDLELILSVLEENDFFFEDKKLKLSKYIYSRQRYDVPPITNRTGIRVELHLRLLNESIDPQNNFAKDAIDSGIKVRQGHVEVNLLAKEFLALHIIYHATIKEYFDNGMVCLLDLVKICRKSSLDYEKLLILSKKYNLFKATSSILAILCERNAIKDLNTELLFPDKEKNFRYVEDLLLINTPDPVLSALFEKLSAPKKILQSKNKLSNNLNITFFFLILGKLVKFLWRSNFRSNLIKSHKIKKMLAD